MHKLLLFSFLFYTNGKLLYTPFHTLLFFHLMIYLGAHSRSHKTSSVCLTAVGAPCPGSWPFAKLFPCRCTYAPFPLTQQMHKSHLVQVLLELSDLNTRCRIAASEGVCLSSWWTLGPSGRYHCSLTLCDGA